jgi:hypothetical protein
MISHKHKCIFIHIPKCAGSSIRDFYFDTPRLNWKLPNYELLYGWCPKRKIHLQHATSQQLLELDLVKPEIWNNYFKFTFIRNPYDRAVSDYFWLMKDRNIKGSFKDYITKKNVFKPVLSDNSVKEYRGDHILQQTDFFDFSGNYKMDFIGKFEHLRTEINKLNDQLGISKEFDIHAKKNSSRKNHYSIFYTNTRKRLVETYFKKDMKLLDYKFEDKRTGLNLLKKCL